MRSVLENKCFLSCPFEYSPAQTGGTRKELTFLAGKLLTAQETCIAPRTLFLPDPLLQSPVPRTGPSLGPPPPSLWTVEVRPRPPAAAPRPEPGLPGSITVALGMLRVGRGGRFAPQALALGGRRAGARLQLELRRLELELLGVSPAPLSLRARAREPREAAGQHPSQSSPVRSPEPRAGQPPGRSLASGTRAARWHCQGTSRTAR